MHSNPVRTLTPHPQLWVRWFVQYNPLFTLSALFVFGGVLILSRALGPDADVALTLVLEGYQVLLIGLAGLLYRRLSEHRPGVILGVIALVFLIDPTLQVSALASSGATAFVGMWVVAFALKWRALEWCFQLRLSTTARVLPPLGAAFMAVLPQIRVLGVAESTTTAILAIGGMVLAALWTQWQPRITSLRTLGELGVLMFPRLLHGALAIGIVGVLFQAWNVALAIGPRAFLAAVGGGVLGLAATTHHERWVWLGSAGAMIVGASASPLLALILATLALALASRRHAPRVAVVAVVLGAQTLENLLPWINPDSRQLRFDLQFIDEVVVFVTLVTATLLVANLIQRRLAYSGIPALVVLWRKPLVAFIPQAADVEVENWGLALVAAGFVFLPLGVWAQRRAASLWSSMRDEQEAIANNADDAERSIAATHGDFPPASPAAIPH